MLVCSFYDACLLALLQHSISRGRLCLRELLLFRFVPKHRAYLEIVLLVLPCLILMALPRFCHRIAGHRR